MSEYKIDTEALADAFAAAMEPHLDRVQSIMDNNGVSGPSRDVILHTACEIFAVLWPHAMLARTNLDRMAAVYGCLPHPTPEEKLEGVRLRRAFPETKARRSRTSGPKRCTNAIGGSRRTAVAQCAARSISIRA